MLGLPACPPKYSTDPPETVTQTKFTSKNQTKFVQDNMRMGKVTEKEHKVFLVAWTSEYIACTILRKVVLKYFYYIDKIMKGETGGLSFFDSFVDVPVVI